MKTNETALNKFMTNIAEATALLEELSEYFADHMQVNPDDVNWGHVGDASYFLEKMKEMTDKAFNRGEYAE